MKIGPMFFLLLFFFRIITENKNFVNRFKHLRYEKVDSSGNAGSSGMRFENSVSFRAFALT